MNLPENESHSIKQPSHEIKANTKTGPQIQMAKSLDNGWSVKIHESRMRKKANNQQADLPKLTKEIDMMTRVINFFKDSEDSGAFLTLKHYMEANNAVKGGFAQRSVQRRFYDTTSQLVALGLLDRGLERNFDKGYRWTGTTNPTIFVRMSRSMKACQLLFKTCHVMQYVRSFKRNIVGDVLQAFPQPNRDPKKRRLGTVISLFIALGWIQAVGKTVLSVTEDFPQFNSFGDQDDEIGHHFDIKPQHRFDLLSHADLEKAKSCIESYNGIMKFAEQRPSSARSAAQILRDDILDRIRASEQKEAKAQEEKRARSEEKGKRFDYFGDSPQIFEDEG